jgi:hypothetical protein
MRVLKLVSSNVTPLHKRRAEDTVRALEQLLDRARAGEIKALVWSAMDRRDRHEPGATGEYLQDLNAGVHAVARLMNALYLHDPE